MFEAVVHALMTEVRERTTALVAHLSEPQLTVALSPIMSPLAWDLGHVAAYEDLWLNHRVAGRGLLRQDLAALYDAFEAADFDALVAVWEHSERVVCTHPGWPTLHGADAVLDSWRRILAGPRLQFILTDERVEVSGDVAWVTLDENLIAGNDTGGTVAALNLFSRGPDAWRMIAHHGSSVLRTL